MARAKKSALAATPETTPTIITIDVIDLITASLNELSGIDFARDAWENKAPDQYGVVEMNGEPQREFADGKMIDTAFTLTVTLYVTGGANTWWKLVTDKMQALEDANSSWLGIVCRLTDHEYQYDIHKVRWVFTLEVTAPLVHTEEST